MNRRISACLLALAVLQAYNATAKEMSADVRRALEHERQVVETVQKLVPAFVFIGGGSGVLISADGLMLTNNHVAKGNKKWRVRVGAKWHDAEVLGFDPRGDIALLKLKNVTHMPFVEFAESDKLKVGQQVIAIGNPFGTADIDGDPSISTGIISALHRFQESYSDSIQTDAAINPGNSGGPLLTMDGKLAGINGMITSKNGERANTGIGLAIPAKQIQRFLPQLECANCGIVCHGIIRGLVNQADEADGMQNGAEIKEVRADTPAQKLGFLTGDRITRVDDYKIHNFARFQGVIGTYPAGTEIKISAVRNGKSLTIPCKLDTFAPPSWGADFKRSRNPRDPVVISKITPKGPAEEAGLKTGDTIVGINGNPIENTFQFMSALVPLQLMAGDTLKVKLRRADKEESQEREVSLTLGSAYDNP